MRNTRTRRRRSPARRLLIAAFIALAVFAIARAGHRSYDRLSDRYDVKKVVVDLSPQVRVEPAVSASFPHGGSSFHAMMARLQPYAAINGTYYDERRRPLGDIVVDGKVLIRGAQHHAIAVTNSGKVRFLERPDGRKFDWRGYRDALACGPRLVHNGKPSVNPEKDGFSSAARTKAAWRSAVGKTAGEKLLLVVVQSSITLDEMARIMIEQGAVEAMNLDGGGACGLYHDGKLLAEPALPMTNVLAVYRR